MSNLIQLCKTFLGLLKGEGEVKVMIISHPVFMLMNKWKWM